MGLACISIGLSASAKELELKEEISVSEALVQRCIFRYSFAVMQPSLLDFKP